MFLHFHSCIHRQHIKLLPNFRPDFVHWTLKKVQCLLHRWVGMWRGQLKWSDRRGITECSWLAGFLLWFSKAAGVAWACLPFFPLFVSLCLQCWRGGPILTSASYQEFSHNSLWIGQIEECCQLYSRFKKRHGVLTVVNVKEVLRPLEEGRTCEIAFMQETLRNRRVVNMRTEAQFNSMEPMKAKAYFIRMSFDCPDWLRWVLLCDILGQNERGHKGKAPSQSFKD